jgi:hypothetical protein
MNEKYTAMHELMIISNIKKNKKDDEFDLITSKSNIDSTILDKILNICIAFNINMFIKSDYRDHLNISELITSSSIQATNSSQTIKKHALEHNTTSFEKIVLKNKTHLLKNEIVAEFNVLDETAYKIINMSIQLVIEYLNILAREKKLNVRGIIQILESGNNETIKTLSANYIYLIKELSINNRKRTTSYQRGKKDNSINFNMNYIIALVIVSIIMYYYIYLL